MVAKGFLLCRNAQQTCRPRHTCVYRYASCPQTNYHNLPLFLPSPSFSGSVGNIGEPGYEVIILCYYHRMLQMHPFRLADTYIP